MGASMMLVLTVVAVVATTFGLVVQGLNVAIASAKHRDFLYEWGPLIVRIIVHSTWTALTAIFFLIVCSWLVMLKNFRHLMLDVIF